MTLKRCSQCLIDQPLTMFHKNIGKKYGVNHSCKKCKCARVREAYRKWGRKKQRYNSKIRRTYQEGVGVRYKHSKMSAIKRGYVFDLSKEQYLSILSLDRCTYCHGRLNKTGSGLDRFDNSLGYTVENSVPCCGRCNEMKGRHLTGEEMISIWSSRLQNDTKYVMI